MRIEKNVKFPLNNMVNCQEIEKNAKFLLNNMESCYQGLKYALSGRLEIPPCVLQDMGPLGLLPCSHSTTTVNHSKQGIGYHWMSAILRWLVIISFKSVPNWWLTNPNHPTHLKYHHGASKSPLSRKNRRPTNQPKPPYPPKAPKSPSHLPCSTLINKRANTLGQFLPAFFVPNDHCFYLLNGSVTFSPRRVPHFYFFVLSVSH